MDIVILAFVAFYFLIGVFVLRDRGYMRWKELRERYSCSRSDFLKIPDPKDFHRFVYAINKRWHSTNYIEIRLDTEYLYFCGETYFWFWGWLFPPIKIPFTDLQYGGQKRYWANKREVVQLDLNEHVVKYGLPKELFENINELCAKGRTTNHTLKDRP
jgi:hypothetical protein